MDIATSDMSPKAPPVIDFGPFYGSDEAAQQRLVEQVRDACTEHGFFQLVNHGVSPHLQRAVLEQSEELFKLPLSVKESYNKDIGGFHRGYERLRSQNFEKKTAGDLKEGYYFGEDLPLDHPHVIAKKANLGPNKYPDAVSNPTKFKETVDEYREVMKRLAGDILKVLATTLGLDQSMFKGLFDTPIATLRLLHYPPQEPDASDLERGIGAHTDFGAVTILLQDAVGGLQVWDRASSSWADVVPVADAFVINLGNLMMRWTNDKYLSNLHRVMNKTGYERYSVPFFFSGNPDFIVKCLPNCEGESGAKYPPITVNEWIRGRFVDTYGGSKEHALAELSTSETISVA